MYQFATAAAAVCVYLFVSVWRIRVLRLGTEYDKSVGLLPVQ